MGRGRGAEGEGGGVAYNEAWGLNGICMPTSSAASATSASAGVMDDDFYSDFTTSPASFLAAPTEDPINVPWFKRAPVTFAAATLNRYLKTHQNLSS